MTRQWIDRGLRVSVEAREGVAYLNFVGLVTWGTMAGFVTRPSDDVGPAYAILARFDQAIVCTKAGEFTRLFSLPIQRRLLAPAAIVCNEGDRPVFSEHARESADLGVIRAVFTDASQARAWTRERASAARLAALMVAQQRAPVRRPAP